MARLAHELRNPLAPIRMALQIMQLSEADVGTSRAARVIIDRQLQHLTRLVDDIADISHLQLGQLRLKNERTTLSAVVQAALELARTQLESQQNVLQIQLPEEPVSLVADAARLSQALANVLTNASKYSELASRIRISAAHTAEHVTIRVEDEGLGIPPALLTRVFEPFVQVDRHGAGIYDGLGIGLAITRNVVEAHGGSVRAQSEGDRRGSCFLLELPRGEAATAVASSSASTTTGALSLRILVADDNRDAAQTLAIMLGFEGHEVRTAHDGLEVLATGQLFTPDLVLLDIGMPVMDGYQTARQIRERQWGRHVYLVALTGWGQEADREAALANGFEDHLVKPASPEKLGSVIEAAKRASRAGASSTSD
jgi:CheY-like chemotaxis protein